MANFQHVLIFWNTWCFFERFFAQNYSNVNTGSILTCLRQFKILAQIEYFAKAIVHAKAIDFARWPIFNMVSFLEYLVFFRAVFCAELLQGNTESILTYFRQFKILAQIEYFAKAIAHAKAIDFARWPIFNIVSFLEYLVFLRAVFLHRITPMRIQNRF